jgi:hypothetical protein
VRDLAVLFLHLLAAVARLAGPGGARSVVAESVLVKHQLLILNRARKRSPNLRPSDRMVAGLCTSAVLACARFGRQPTQARVRAMTVEIAWEIEELHLQIRSRPEHCPERQ